MASRATHAQSQECLPRVDHDFIQGVLPSQTLRHVVGPDLARQQHRRRHQEPGRRVLTQEIAGNLLPDKPVVRRVRVEGLDDIIPIWPGVRSLSVDLESVGVRKPDHVQPMLRPTLPVPWGSQQPVHHPLVRVPGRIPDKPVHLFRRRRQSHQVQGNAAQPRGPIRLPGRPQPLPLESGQNESVDRIPDPAFGPPLWNRRLFHGLERPVIRRPRHRAGHHHRNGSSPHPWHGEFHRAQHSLPLHPDFNGGFDFPSVERASGHRLRLRTGTAC